MRKMAGKIVLNKTETQTLLAAIDGELSRDLPWPENQLAELRDRTAANALTEDDTPHLIEILAGEYAAQFMQDNRQFARKANDLMYDLDERPPHA